MRAAPVVDQTPSVLIAPLDASTLFEGLDDEQLACLEHCLGARSFLFEQGEQILACTEKWSRYGVLSSGVAFDVRLHPDGTRSLVDVIEPGDLFGEGWRAGRWLGGKPPRERVVVAASAGTAILLDATRLTDPNFSCAAKSVVQNNLLRSALHKEERLRAKLELLRHRSLRARIAGYLTLEAQRRGSSRFSIPLSRGELAEYLHADRAALSRELARMQGDGLIEFHLSTFDLRNPSDELSELPTVLT